MSREGIDETRSELDRLAYDWCEGHITDEDLARLESFLDGKPERRRYFLDYVEIYAQLRWEVAEEDVEGQLAGIELGTQAAVAPAGAGPPSPVQAPTGQRDGKPAAVSHRARTRRWIVGALATSAAAAALVVFIMWQGGLREGPIPVPAPALPALAIVESTENSVQIGEDGGGVRPAAAGRPIVVEETLRTAMENGQARVRFDSDVMLDCGADTELRFLAEAERTAAGPPPLLHLRGNLAIAVAARAGRGPLVVRTPHGEIRVVGTRLRSLVGAAATRVETEDGRVEVIRASDKARTEVRQGQYVLVGDAGEPLAVRETPLVIAGPSRVLKQDTNEIPQSVVFSGDGKTLVTGDSVGTLRFWDLATGTPRRKLQAGQNIGVTGLARSPDGRLLATVDSAGWLRLWKADTGETAGGPPQRFGRGFGLAFCDGGALVATEGAVAGPRAVVRLWDVAKGRHAADLPLDANHVRCLAAVGDGRLLASGDSDGNLTLWDTRTHQRVRQFRAHERPVMAVAISPDGKWLATGSTDAAVKLWDASDGRLRATLKGHTNDVLTLAFCPDRMLLASGDHGIIRLWDLRSAREVVVFRGNRWSEMRIAFSPDGRVLAMAGTRQAVRLWDVPEEVRQSSGVWSR